MDTNIWRRFLDISLIAGCVAFGACEADVDPGIAGDSGGAALEAVDEGEAERRRIRSNFQVQVDGRWRGICCVDGIPQVTTQACTWSEYDRTLTDETAGLELDCPEGDPANCVCNWDGERLHGFNGWEVDASLYAEGGGPVYPDELTETCLVVDWDGSLESEWTGEDCPYFKLK